MLQHFDCLYGILNVNKKCKCGLCGGKKDDFYAFVVKNIVRNCVNLKEITKSWVKTNLVAVCLNHFIKNCGFGEII